MSHKFKYIYAYGINEHALCDITKCDQVSNNIIRKPQALDSLNKESVKVTLFRFTKGHKQRAKYAVLELSRATQRSSKASQLHWSPRVKAFKLGSLSTSSFHSEGHKFTSKKVRPPCRHEP